MKRNFTKILAAVALLVGLAIPMGVWGQTRSEANLHYTGSTTFTWDANANYAGQLNLSATEWSVTGQKNDANNMTACNKDGSIRLYPGSGNGSSITVTNLNNATIESISFTMQQNTPTVKVNNSIVEPQEGVYVINSPSFVVINGINASSGNQVQIKSIAITYTGGTSNTYTVTYNCNGGTSGCPENVTGVAAGTSINLAGAPEKTDYTFDGWNDGTTTYEAGASYTVNGNVTFTAQWTENTTPGGDEQWVLTNLADLTTNDVFVIVGNNGSNFAMSNNNGTGSAPSAVAVTVADNAITSNVANNIQWTISGNATDGYTFYPNESTTTWLYCTNTNNGVRVGSGNAKHFKLSDNGYLTTTETTEQRFLGIFSSQDWRCYTSNGGNIANQTFAFYKKVTGGIVPPSIAAENVSIEYDATSGTITYTINNEPDPAGILSANTSAEWLTIGTVGETVPFTCSANAEGTARTATVTLTYTYGDNETVTKDVTVTQGAVPVIYTTIPQLFEAATSTSTSVTVTFGNWVVTGVNGSQSFVTDGTNGFIMYQNNHGFEVGNTLSGVVNCNLVLFNGSAEITGLTTATEGLSVGANGDVTPRATTIDALGAVNTGSVVTLSNLTYNGTTLTDGTNTIDFYTSLYNGTTLVNGKTYNITGVFVLNNSTKRILPRNAADIEEVALPSITVTPTTVSFAATGTNGVQIETLTITYENIEVATWESFTVQYYDNEGTETTTPTDWPVVGVTGSNDEGYSVRCVSNDNTGDARTAYFKVYAYDANNNKVYSELVTVNQGAYVAPFEPTTYTLATSIESGKTYIITDGLDRAMGVQNGTVRSAADVTIDESTATVNTADVYEFVISGNETDGYTIFDSKASGYLYASSSSSNNIGTRAENSDANSMWAIESGDENGVTITAKGDKTRNSLRYNYNQGNDRFSCYGSNSSLNATLYLFVKEETPTNPTITVNGYGDTDGGYVLLAWPESTSPANIEGMISDNLGAQVTPENPGTYDLYSYDESQEKEWLNYRTNNFELVPGKGYLYASKAGVTLTYEGEASPVFADVNLPYTENKIVKSIYLAGNSQTNEQTFYVYNGELAKQSFNYLTMNEDGNGFISAQATSYTAPAMTGFFVQAPGANMTLSTTDVNAKANVSLLNINVLRNRGSVIDNAIVSFSNGSMMDKFYLMNNTTRVYIPQGNREMAIANSAAQGEMPVSFRASENGTYTIAVEAENVDMNYLHLIDNMTGADVDLLATPNYTFEARTNDYTSRFRLVFSANGIDEQTAETFAFFNGTSWTVSNTGDATLQVVDITGRIVSSETINGNATVSLNQPAGIYMLRLVNGNDVKVQKVVVR